MLYDNALLIALYSEVYRIHQKPIYREIVRRTAAWLLREMLVPDGAFACSLDAESDEKATIVSPPTRRTCTRPSADAFQRRYFDRSTDFDGAKTLNRSNEPSVDAEQPISSCSATDFGRARATQAAHRDDKIAD
jgi:uncharacterized protein YyaL (SSP411 family)